MLSDQEAAANLLGEEDHTAARAAAKQAKNKKQKAKRLLAKQQQQEAQGASNVDSSVSVLPSSSNVSSLPGRPTFGNSLSPTRLANVSSLLTPEQSSEARPRVAIVSPQDAELSSSDEACKQLHFANLSLSSNHDQLQHLLCCPTTQMCHFLLLHQNKITCQAS